MLKIEHMFYFWTRKIPLERGPPKGKESGKQKSLQPRHLDWRDGGGGWIRTIEVVDNRFTVCPLWPLGNSSV